MSTDYFIHIKNKSTHKEIGCFLANQLKTIIDSKHCAVANLNAYSNDKKTVSID